MQENSVHCLMGQRLSWGRALNEVEVDPGKSYIKTISLLAVPVLIALGIALTIQVVLPLATFNVCISLVSILFVELTLYMQFMNAFGERAPNNCVSDVVNLHNTNGVSKAGDWYSTDVKVINNVSEGFQWKKRLIEKARSSVECSFNFTGGECLNEVLEIIEERLRVCKTLKVHLIMSDDLLENENIQFLKKLRMRYSLRFFYLVTTRCFSRTEFAFYENHVKLLIVDEKYFVVGGSGVYEKMVREEIPKETKLAKTIGGIILDAAFRDADIIGCGVLATGLRGQFYNLYLKWSQKMGKIFVADEVLKFPISDRADIIEFHEAVDLIKNCSVKFLIYGPEHTKNNSITQEYCRLIASATKTIKIANLLFIPGKHIQLEMQNAQTRGVDIEGVFNGPGSMFSVSKTPINFANRQYYSLLNRVYEYKIQHRQYHKKVAIIDDKYSIIGSYNLGFKSDSRDDEIVLVIDNEKVAAHLNVGLDQDIKDSNLTQARQSSLVKCFFSRIIATII